MNQGPTTAPASRLLLSPCFTHPRPPSLTAARRRPHHKCWGARDALRTFGPNGDPEGCVRERQMRRVWVGAIGLVLAVGDAGAQGPPRARRDEQAVDALHGVRVPDPYRWLEEMGSEETRQWVAAQDAYARRFVAGLPTRQALRDRIAAIAAVERIGAPVVRGGRYFTTRFGAAGPGASAALL